MLRLIDFYALWCCEKIIIIQKNICQVNFYVSQNYKSQFSLRDFIHTFCPEDLKYSFPDKK